MKRLAVVEDDNDDDDDDDDIEEEEEGKVHQQALAPASAPNPAAPIASTTASTSTSASTPTKPAATTAHAAVPAVDTAMASAIIQATKGRDQAEKERKAANFEGAIESCRMAVEALRAYSPDNTSEVFLMVPWAAIACEIFHIQGACHMQLYQHKAAILAFSHSIRLQSPATGNWGFKSLVQRAFAYDALGQTRMALADSDTILKIEPGNTLVQRNRHRFQGELATQNTQDAQDYKHKGNDAFKTGDWAGAIDHYTSAIKLLDAVGPKATCTLAGKQLIGSLFSNRAISHLKLEQFKQAKADCDRALVYDRSDDNSDEVKALRAKVFHRRGLAFFGLANFEEAKKDFERVLTVDNGNVGAKAELAKVEAAIKSSGVQVLSSDHSGTCGAHVLFVTCVVSFRYTFLKYFLLVY
jgi:tetratricopeptide (TPR) repeat protein